MNGRIGVDSRTSHYHPRSLGNRVRVVPARKLWPPKRGFVHLHVHSSYSLLEGALTIGKLADLAKADRQPRSL